MKISTVFIYINFLTIVLIAAYLLQKNDTTGVVNMPELYNQYQGRKDVESRFVEKINNLNYLIDSLNNLVELVPVEKNKEIMNKIIAFNQEKERAEMDMQQQVWNQLNQYMLDFGKSHKYKLILGANNNGNIVYSNEAVDLTNELVYYVNLRYSGK